MKGDELVPPKASEGRREQRRACGAGGRKQCPWHITGEVGSSSLERILTAMLDPHLA